MEQITTSILQWNVLAAGLEVSSMPLWGNINHKGSRSNQIASKILQLQPDIICLQELNHFDTLLEYLSSYQYTGQTLLKCHPSVAHILCDGVGIFWSTKKYKLISSLPIKEPDRWNQVCLVLLLEIIDTGKTIMLASTHLKAIQRDYLEQLRCQQVIYFTDTINQWLSSLKCPEPDLFCYVGDMNSTPEDPFKANWKKKSWKGNAIKEFEMRGYKSAWHVYEAKKNNKEDDKVCADIVTFRTHGEVALYDYIMFKGNASVVDASGPRPWSDTTESYHNNPSDHLHLFVTFRL